MCVCITKTLGEGGRVFVPLEIFFPLNWRLWYQPHLLWYGPTLYNGHLPVFLCLRFIVPLKNFHSYGDVTITGEGLQILNHARHSWPLSSEGSLACHTYCETSVYNGHLRGPVTLTPIAQRYAVELSLPVFTT